MRIPAVLIPHIERALELELTDKQKLFLCRGGFSLQPEEGRQLTHCIRLALIDGAALDLSKPESFSDKLDWRYSRREFLPTFLTIYDKLKRGGLEVRPLVREGVEA